MLLVILCLCLNFFSPVYASEESERILAEISRVHVSMHHQIEEIHAPDATHVVVLGITGSGKSTLIHALAGKNLMVTKGARKFQIDPDHLLPGFSIGHGVVSSTTLPVCWHDRESNIVYWDCPGFFDSRGAAQDIINAFATDVIFSLSGRKKVLLVLGAQELDLRGTEMKNRLEKIQRLLPQREELESCVHLVLSQTQSNPDFPYIDVLDGMTREIDDPLLRFFASSPNLVFEFPKPTHVGPYRLFQKRREVIQSLLGGDPLRIHHNIDLDAHIKMSLFQMMKKMGDVKIMIHQLSSLLQDSYRREDLDPLHNWHNRIDRVLRESSEQALSQRPLDFSSVIRGCVPEHMMTQPIKELLSKIYLNQQFFVFLGRVHQQGGWDATDIPNLFEIAQPFLHNIQKELETLIQQKQYIREQQEALERTRKLLEEERLNREKQQRAQRERLQEIEEEARLRISGIMLEIQRAKEIATEQNRKIVRLQQSSASAHTSFDSDKERLEGEIRDSKNQLGRLNEQMQTLQAHLKQIETEKKSIDCQNQGQEQILQSQHAELVRENVLLSTTIAELEAAINGNATRIRQIQEEADRERQRQQREMEVSLNRLMYKASNEIDVSFLSLFEQANRLNNPLGQVMLGECYLEGRGVRKDEAEAIRLFRLAVEQENSRGQVMLGDCYLNGKGVRKDEAEGVRLVRLAAEQGDPLGQVTLGISYLEGKGLRRDEAEALRLFRLVANQEYPFGLAVLGRCYLEGKGVRKDEAEGVRLVRLALEKGFKAPLCILAFCYLEGKGVRKDEAEGVKLLRLAVEQENSAPDLKTFLGICYREGKGVRRDETEAVRLFRLAATQGDENASEILRKIRR